MNTHHVPPVNEIYKKVNKMEPRETFKKMTRTIRLFWSFSWTFLVVPFYLPFCIFHLPKRYMMSVYVWPSSDFVFIIDLEWHFYPSVFAFFTLLQINIIFVLAFWNFRLTYHSNLNTDDTPKIPSFFVMYEISTFTTHPICMYKLTTKQMQEYMVAEYQNFIVNSENKNYQTDQRKKYQV
jgi:hypothetical protein